MYIKGKFRLGILYVLNKLLLWENFDLGDERIWHIPKEVPSGEGKGGEGGELFFIRNKRGNHPLKRVVFFYRRK